MSIIAILITGIMSITGIWSCWDSSDGNWDKLAPLLAANGYDAVFYMVACGPVIDGEGLQECMDACLPLGIDVHAWVVMRKTDQCNVELMAGICLRIAAEYPVTGIHLDYIRYNCDLSGYSGNTRDLFLEESNLRSVNWPDDCIRGGQYYERFIEWRAGRMTVAVRAVRDSLNRINRIVQLSAAVMPHEREMFHFSQIWNRWLERDLLSFVITMNFTESDSQFVLWGEEQLELAGDHMILCGIGELSGTTELTETETLHQIALAEDIGFDGWVIYHLCDKVIERLIRIYDSDTGD